MRRTGIEPGNGLFALRWPGLGGTWPPRRHTPLHVRHDLGHWECTGEGDATSPLETGWIRSTGNESRKDKTALGLNDRTTRTGLSFSTAGRASASLLLVARTVAGLENVAGLMNRHGKQQRNDKFIVK